MQKPKSQNDLILEKLKAGGVVTPMSAFQMCGTLALHSRIAELRKRGYDIRMDLMEQGGKRFGSYTLAEANK